MNSERMRFRLMALCSLAMLCSLMGCAPPEPDRVQGYVEGEYVYVASPLSGTLESLCVQRGMQVKEGDALFALDSTPERADVEEARRRALEAAANLEDAKKGSRPSEIESIEETIKQARTALVLSEKELMRREHLFAAGAISAEALDQARAANDQNRHRVSQLEADMKTAGLGSRSDRISAAQAALEAQEAALERARWELAQKSRFAPQDALVFDTLYREGEWVGAGRAVVALLPPQNIKVRAFVPETRIGAIRIGDSVRVSVDGMPNPFFGKVSYKSPRAEYTPPVIYSREARSKLVFMIEAVFDPKTAQNLHPGQPVDVKFGF
ncbi:MAG TPA: HlyD family efflux transporter periplasmic adaptor subunit [Syntrophobacteraceae bacterium]|nr:HlyD family efflux transporter periplasmic adaptor subunit [Syntrophobacteraceae bacterium]